MRGRYVLPDSRGINEKQGFFTAILHLVGHVLGGAVLFLSVAGVTWALGYAIEWLNTLHPFPGSVLSLLHGFEMALLWADVLLSGTVVFYGLWQFLMHLGGSRYD